MDRLINSKQQQSKPFLRSIKIGGTNADTAQGGIEALGGIHNSKISSESGIAPLDAIDKIPVQFFPPIVTIVEPMLDGPTSVFTALSGSYVKYVITNFDSEIEYVVTTNKGSVTLLGSNGDARDTFRYTPQNTPGIAVITINGKNFPIQLVASYVDIPLIDSPLDNTTIDQHNIIFSTSNQDASPHGFINASVFPIWQIATDIDFTNIIHEGTYDLSWVYISTITGSLYARVKFEVTDADNNGITVTTPWSKVVSFTAWPTTIPSTLLQVINDHITPNDGIIFPIYNVSHDGALLGVLKSGNGIPSGGGISYMDSENTITLYKRTETLPKVYEVVKIFPSNPMWFIDTASSIHFSSDNQRLFVNCRISYLESNLGNSLTRILVYKTTVNGVYTDWTLEQTISLDLSVVGTGLLSVEGNRCEVSQDDSTIAVGIVNMTKGGNPLESGTLSNSKISNAIVIFKKDQNGLYQQTQVILDPYPDETSASFSSQFGISINLSYDGAKLTTIAPSARTFVDTTPSTQKGALCVYELDVGDYVRTYEYKPSLLTDGIAVINYSVFSAKNADVIVIGGWDIDDYQVVMVFEKLNNIWTITQINPPGWKDSNSYLQGQIDSCAISDDGSFIALGSSSSSTFVSFQNAQSTWDSTGYVCFYNKGDIEWMYGGLLENDTPPATMGSFGYQLKLTVDNELVVFSKDYDRWTTFYNDYTSNPYQGAILIYK